MVKKAKHHGAKYMYLSTQVTMSDGQREFFLEKAEKDFQGTADIYIRKYKKYYYCRSPKSKKLWDMFVNECEKEGMIYDMKVANNNIRSGYASSFII